MNVVKCWYRNTFSCDIKSKMATLADVLKSIYYNPSHPASYSGIQSLYRAVKADGRVKPNVKDIKSWLEEQDTYTLGQGFPTCGPRGNTVQPAKLHTV